MSSSRDTGGRPELGAVAGPAVDQEVFRDVIGHFPSGVTIVTARADELDYGVTVSALASLSMEPPMLLACLNQISRTKAVIERTRAFAVNVLTEEQEELAALFATNSDDKFKGLDVHYGTLGAPLFTGALAHVECRVVDTAVGGTHTVFLAEVERAERFGGSPLAHFRGRYVRLAAEPGG
jgi:4-nitrophenol 2-monooxygenase / 4-nitrocatechol 4-monooxygenase, reductase component